MTKGWRNNIALVERRDRLARERAERRIAAIKNETALAMQSDGSFVWRDGRTWYYPPFFDCPLDLPKQWVTT